MQIRRLPGNPADRAQVGDAQDQCRTGQQQVERVAVDAAMEQAVQRQCQQQAHQHTLQCLMGAVNGGRFMGVHDRQVRAGRVVVVQTQIKVIFSAGENIHRKRKARLTQQARVQGQLCAALIFGNDLVSTQQEQTYLFDCGIIEPYLLSPGTNHGHFYP